MKVRARDPRRVYVDHHAGRVCLSCLDPLPAYRKGPGRPLIRCAQCTSAAENAKKNARKRGATILDLVYPLEVFRLALWRCRLCGCDTPREFVGLNRTNSPELDHILAIGLGGPHTRENTQLLCRACNAIKSKSERPSAIKHA